ncbi:hypothetical protein EDC01DRAFT_701942 [Geopyxis carbonaria]|nr:hypothetical protein EDC01DRAFT_701942 [Geopyxis carbonaria]
MALLNISERIAALTETHRECTSQIAALSKLSGPSSQLAASIHATLRDAENTYELLSDDLAALRPSPSLPALRAQASKLGEDLRLARLGYRKAQLSAKRLGEAELLKRKAPASGAGVNEAVSQGELVQSAAGDVTAALRRTQELMRGELAKSAFAAETLAASGEALQELGTRYGRFDDVIARSRELVRDLVRKNKSDRWYYETAIQVLLGVLLWIVVRRLFWGPLYLLLVMPLRGVWWVLGGVGGVMTGGKGGAGVSSIVGTGVTTEVQWASVPTAVTAVHEVEEERGDLKAVPTISEVVGKIIDGEPTTIVRNPKSRKFEHDPAAESAAAERMKKVVEKVMEKEKVKEAEVKVEVEKEEVVEFEPEPEVEPVVEHEAEIQADADTGRTRDEL